MIFSDWIRNAFMTKCANCNEHKLSFTVRRRRFYAKALNLWLTSNNRLCNRCASIYKRV